MPKAKKGQRGKSQKRQSQGEAWARDAVPSYILATLALAGTVLSSYLTYIYVASAKAAFCPQGSGCNVVQASSHSRILDVPVALIGALGYAAILAVVVWGIRSRRTRWLPTYLLALAGFVFSMYLTYLELFVIKAVCPYCLVSLGLIVAILAVALYMGGRKRTVLTPGLGFASVLLAAIVLGTSSLAPRTLAKEEAPQEFRVDLARHLADSGAAMYGAYWCPHCTDQKKLFGDAFKYVKYVECAPDGKNANPLLCQQKGIKGYPTWEIKGKLYEGVLSLDDLASLTGYAR